MPQVASTDKINNKKTHISVEKLVFLLFFFFLRDEVNFSQVRLKRQWELPSKSGAPREQRIPGNNKRNKWLKCQRGISSVE